MSDTCVRLELDLALNLLEKHPGGNIYERHTETHIRPSTVEAVPRRKECLVQDAARRGPFVKQNTEAAD